MVKTARMEDVSAPLLRASGDHSIFLRVFDRDIETGLARYLTLPGLAEQEAEL